MLKICYLLPQYKQESAENFYHIINFLSELGKKVQLYVIIENSDDNPIIDNVEEIFIINGAKKKNYLFRFLKIINIYFNLYRKGIRIFFSRASSTGVFPLIIANKVLNNNKASIIFWNCGQDVVPLSFKPTRKNYIRLLTRVLRKYIFNKITFLATGPELMTDYYNSTEKIPREKILLLYNDISLERFFPLSEIEKNNVKDELLRTNKKIMLFVHTFNYSRGADLLHKIALRIKEENLDVLVLAIGRHGDYSARLDTEIKTYKLEKTLVNLGTIPNKDIVQYYQISDLFIMPSRGEGFPRVLLESMACRCVPFSFDVGGVRNIIHEDIVNDTVVQVPEEREFIYNSIDLILNKKQLEKYADLSYEKVKQYKTEIIVDMYVDKFNSITNENIL